MNSITTIEITQLDTQTFTEYGEVMFVIVRDSTRDLSSYRFAVRTLRVVVATENVMAVAIIPFK